jgi:hypothetical protein
VAANPVRETRVRDALKALSDNGSVRTARLPGYQAARPLRRYHDAVPVDVYRRRLYPVQ